MRRIDVPAALLALGLGLLPGRAAADAGAAFEVIVLRGAEVARVSGDARGALREEILRADPRPAREPAPQPEAAADPGPALVVVLDAGAPRSDFGLAAPFFVDQRFPPHRFGPPRRVYRPGPTPPRFHHGRRGHAPRRGDPRL